VPHSVHDINAILQKINSRLVIGPAVTGKFMYVCTECKETKAKEDFYFHKNGGRKSSKCKPCYVESRKTYSSNWKESNMDHVKEYNKNYYDSEKRLELHYKKEYNITLQDYDLMYEQQNGKCKICESTESKTPKSGRFCVDHDHATGEVRGLLCSSCNRGIGLLQDDPDVILNAYRYLTCNK